jgi:hypothetical protein
MLKDRKRKVERTGFELQRNRRLAQLYAEFLRTLFSLGDWFVTLTFRDQYQDSEIDSDNSLQDKQQKQSRKSEHGITKYEPDPRLESWEPDSRYRSKPGPPVRDAALREIVHLLLEMGWEASGRKRQEIFDRLADGLEGNERRDFAKELARSCLCCAVFNDPVTVSFYYEIEKTATKAIGWVIAEEFGKAGGRWHVHLIVRGVQHLRRKKWWKRAFTRFGRSRIEPIHE